MGRHYRFDDFRIDLEGFRLFKTGQAVSVEPKALNVLIFLVEHRGRLVERRELLGAVWGDAFVTDHVLNRAIGQLRKVLSDDAKASRYIETVPTLGYRFVAEVEAETLASPRAPARPAAPVSSDLHDQDASALPNNSRAENVAPGPPALSALDPVAPRVGDPTETRISRLRARVLLLCAVGLAATVLLMAVLLEKPAVPSPLESTQITFSADAKERPLFTDGARLYFERRGEPSQMAVEGGLIAPMKILEPGMQLLDISTNGSRVLAKKVDLNTETDRGSLWVTSTLGGSPRKLGDHLAEAAVWSPDGHSIAFTDVQTVSVMDENGAHAAKLWDAPGFVSSLSFSPDGQQLCVTVEGTEASRLWILRVDGTKAHPLGVPWPANQDLRDGRWTPDGQHFVFRSDGEGRQNLYEVIKPDWLHFWQKPRAVRITGNQVEIRAAVPSRDGQGLFALGRLDQGALQVFHPESKSLSPFLNGFSAMSFVISPDRQWMAYSEYPSGNLWKSRLDGSEPLQLTNAPAYGQQWSPDGKSLVYFDWHKLYLVSADGGVPEKLIANGDGEMTPTWSADGKSIAFSRWDFVHEPSGISVLDLSSRKVSAMANAESYYVPSWSPDGRYLVAMAENPSRMMLYSTDTKKWRVLKVFDVTWGLWVWSRDSRFLYMGVVQNRKGLYRLSVPDGAWDKVVGLEDVDASPLEGFVSLTADGQPAIMSHTGVSQIYSLRWPH